MSIYKVSHFDPSPSLFQALRVGIMLLVCSMHIALIIISALALSLRSGGGCQIAVIVFGSVTLLLAGSFSLTQKLNPVPDRGLGQTRRLFFVPWIVGFSLGVFFILLARIPDAKLASDYASLGDMSTLVIALGLFSALFACLLPFVYPFSYFKNGFTTRIVTKSQSERPATERSVGSFETLPPFPFPSPLPLVYINPSGRWSYTQPQPQQPTFLALPPINPFKQSVSSDPLFDINLYDVGKLPDGSSSGEELQWPRIGRFSSRVRDSKTTRVLV